MVIPLSIPLHPSPPLSCPPSPLLPLLSSLSCAPFTSLSLPQAMPVSVCCMSKYHGTHTVHAFSCDTRMVWSLPNFKPFTPSPCPSSPHAAVCFTPSPTLPPPSRRCKDPCSHGWLSLCGGDAASAETVRYGVEEMHRTKTSTVYPAIMYCM